MRVSTSSVVSSVLVLRWLTTTERVLTTDMFLVRLTPWCLWYLVRLAWQDLAWILDDTWQTSGKRALVACP